jgi:ATP-dependent Clp protease adaptor protein ClpS
MLPPRSSASVPLETHAVAADTFSEEAWVVLLFDDPVNTMAYVAAALRAVLHVDGPTAEHLMMTAHNEGRAAVFSGDRDEAERICVDLHGWSLNATVVR